MFKPRSRCRVSTDDPTGWIPVSVHAEVEEKRIDGRQCGRNLTTAEQGWQAAWTYQGRLRRSGNRWRWLERPLNRQRENLRERGARREWSSLVRGLARWQRIFKRERPIGGCLGF